MRYFFTKGIIITIILNIFSCSVTDKIPQNEHIIVENTISVNDKKLFYMGDYEDYIRTKENSQFLWLYPLGVFMYQIADKTPEATVDSIVINNPKTANFITSVFSRKSIFKLKRKYKDLQNFLLEEFSEPPRLLNKEDVLLSSENIEKLFHSKGYLDAISLVDIQKDGKKSTINYKVYTDRVYTIDTIHFDTEVPHLKTLYEDYKQNGKPSIKRGDNFNYEKVIEERTRIAKYFNNNGIYYLDLNDILFAVDSNSLKKTVDIYINLKVEISPQGDTIRKDYSKYTISNINILTNYDYDTTLRYFNVEEYKNYNVFFKEDSYYSPEIITNNILFSKGDYYSLEKEQLTKVFLGRLNNFKFIDVKFAADTLNKELRADVNLIPSYKYWINYDLSFSRSNLLEIGLDLSITMGIRNFMRRADIFEISSIFSIGNYKGILSNSSLGAYLFNTSLKWTIPTFMFPYQEKFNYAKRIRPRTEFVFNYGMQNNIGMDREKLDFSVSFVWNESDYKEHRITLPKLGYTMYKNKSNYFNFYISEKRKIEAIYKTVMGVDVPTDKTIEEIVSEINNSGKLEQTLNQKDNLRDVQYRYDMFTRNIFIPSIEYSFIYNNRLLKTDYTYFKFGIESSNNIFHYIVRPLGIFKKDSKTGDYTMSKTPVASFIKIDLHYIKYISLGHYSKFAFRVFTGVGIPLDKSKTMPYDKMYFSGGINYERAWLAYDLGPGGNTQKYISLNVADMKLNFSVEYRFEIYNSLKGALFTDVGNIWRIKNINNSPENELDTFNFNRFYKELGVGFGYGIRYDFDFFVVRLDLAYKVYDPSKALDKRFVLIGQNFLEPTIHFGITYPF